MDVPNQTWSSTRVFSGSIVALSGSEHFLLISGSDMVSRVYDIDNMSKQIYDVPAYRGKIACSAISEAFHSFVIATETGCMMIHSLKDGEVQRVVDLERRRPLRVMVTPGWGFIVACLMDDQGQYELASWTINGMPIGTCTLDADVGAWECHVDYGGFDWMSIALRSQSGAIFHFEVYNMVLGKKIYRQTDVVALSHVKELDAISAVSRSGAIVLIPLITH
jgi:hypothetical protein